MNIENKKSIEQIKEMYATATANDTLGCLVAGDPGVGKTNLLGTAPYPLLVYMFDPKGFHVLRKHVTFNEKGETLKTQNLEKEGKALIVPLWGEQSQDPTMWKKFDDLSKQHMESGFYNLFSTIAIDSATWAIEAAANYTAGILGPASDMKEKKIRPRNIPFMGDYRIIYQLILDKIRDLSTFDVNLIVTAHLETEKDELTGEVTTDILTFKKLKGLLPTNFTEKYTLVAQKTLGKTSPRRILTQPRGRYTLGSSQLGLAAEEVADFRQLLKKGGLKSEDKPLLKLN